MGARNRVGIRFSYRPTSLYIGWQAGTTTRFYSVSIAALDCYKIPALNESPPNRLVYMVFCYVGEHEQNGPKYLVKKSLVRLQCCTAPFSGCKKHWQFHCQLYNWIPFASELSTFHQRVRKIGKKVKSYLLSKSQEICWAFWTYLTLSYLTLYCGRFQVS